jgi:hypothetical protein
MFKFTIAFIVLLCTASIATADDVQITNNTNSPIFRIYAWPQALGPRTFNLLATVLFPKSSRAISVDNAYGDCLFTFSYDVNDRADLERRHRNGKPLTMFDANICTKKGVVSIDPADDALWAK